MLIVLLHLFLIIFLEEVYALHAYVYFVYFLPSINTNKKKSFVLSFRMNILFYVLKKTYFFHLNPILNYINEINRSLFSKKTLLSIQSNLLNLITIFVLMHFDFDR